MNQKKRKPPFKKIQTGFHKYAVIELAEWVGGEIERPLMLDGKILVVPDVTAPDNRFFEVSYKHELNGTKLGLYQYWGYRNNTPVSVFEIDANFILSHLENPGVLTGADCYIFENEPKHLR